MRKKKEGRVASGRDLGIRREGGHNFVKGKGKGKCNGVQWVRKRHMGEEEGRRQNSFWNLEGI